MENLNCFNGAFDAESRKLRALISRRFALFVFFFLILFSVYSLVHILRQPDVRDACGVLAEQVDVGVQDRRIDGLTVLPQDCLRGLTGSKVDVTRIPRDPLRRAI